jgi:peroxisomal membrane protein 4
MTFLFSNKSYIHSLSFNHLKSTDDISLPAKIKGIFLATRTHAFNLAKFVTIYKVFLLIQKKMNGGKERDLDSLIAGGLGGWWVFGERTAVSLLLYLALLIFRR